MADITTEQGATLGLDADEQAACVDEGTGDVWRVLRVAVERARLDGVIPGREQIEPADLKAYLMRAPTQAETDAITAWASAQGISLTALATRCTVAIARLLGKV